MLMLPTTLSLIVTHKCTAACEHCCFGCSPAHSTSIPIADLYRHIGEAHLIPSIRVVVFTGGECFMLGAELDRLVGAVTRQKLWSRVVSNAYWATSPANARKRLEKLQAQGLKEVNVSTGDQHARYVPVEYVRNAAIAAAEMEFKHVVVMIEVAKSHVFKIETFTEDPKIAKFVKEGRILLAPSPWMQFKGQAKVEQSPEVLSSLNTYYQPCHSALRIVAITPSQKAIACCGLPMEQIPELALGDVSKNSVASVIQNGKDDFLKIWIHLEGPTAPIQYARKFDPSINLPESTAHICDACRFLFHEKKVIKTLREHPPEFAASLVKRYVYETTMPRTRLKPIPKTAVEQL